MQLKSIKPKPNYMIKFAFSTGCYLPKYWTVSSLLNYGDLAGTDAFRVNLDKPSYYLLSFA